MKPDAIEFANPNDWTAHFWKHDYIVTLDFGVKVAVNADNEQDALDYVIDFFEVRGYNGFVAELGEIEDDREYYVGGNHSLALTSDYIDVKEFK
jgi:hypothetical protein